MSEAPNLRERLQDPRILVAMGVHDGLTARIAQQLGFEAFYHGGYAAAAHHHGLPDIGMVGLEEMVESVRRVTNVSTTPVIVDCDTAYGAIPGVKRTVHEMERAGAGAIQIEDQVFPKKCGHMEGKQVIAVDEMVLKIRAAVATRHDPSMLIIARTDALQPLGLDEAIDRCNAYAEAGADLAFVDAPGSREQLAEIARRVDVPSVANMSETGKTPALTADELQEMGYRVVIFPATQTWVFARAYEEVCRELLRTGTTAGYADRFASFDDVNALLGLEELQRVE
ncbi:carboxyvinyl-carboxyphosphonate phosphorylmutase [Baekduia soli]|uniref:Carboxyvinyl-carboxyphosphonate phosphorylmutase n=1 Tax=Baekduia soli TaxID=496014 RepID=A0A5B8U5U9_9ACTN|nr:isocitrate lyase/phosphoenolpyruvate mutase family protein [Baekduia soli]QEC48400.1 carboxyvinyl-carboxyphosphonate phosphorylmutase [Baekduia soli]